MNHSKKLMYFLFLAIIAIVILLPKTNIEIFSNELNREKITREYFEIENPKISGSYILGAININNNSEWEVINSTNEWCNGGGTKDNPYIIENCTIIGGWQGIAISIKNSTVYFEIRNCTIEDGGVVFSRVNNGKFINNLVSDYYLPITVIGSSNIISGNTITPYISHYIGDSGSINVYGFYNTITENILNPNIIGIHLGPGSKENYIYKNTIRINRKGIYLEESDKNIIYENNIGDNEKGIYLEKSNENKIYENKIGESTTEDKEGKGILLEESNENEIYENNVEDNDCGIYLEKSDENKIYENDINENELNGIKLKKSDENKIYENDINENELNGICLDKSHKNKLYKNEIKENDESGIYIEESDENGIYKNTIEKHRDGIRIIDSHMNEIYENDINENKIAAIILDRSFNNQIFKNSIGGNQLGILESFSLNWNYYFLNTGISFSFLPIIFYNLLTILMLIVFKNRRRLHKIKSVN